MIKFLYIDLFCGADGTSTGVENARVQCEALGIAIIEYELKAA